MLRIGTRNTSGNGTAILQAGATQRLRVAGYVFVQLTEAGPATAILQFVTDASTQPLHSAIKMAGDGDGVVLELPLQLSAPGAALHLNLDSAKSVNYTIWAIAEPV